MDDERGDILIVVNLIKADEGLEEADDDNDEEGEEDQRFLHHDFDDHQHGAEKAKGVKVQEETHPEHRGRKGEEIVRELVEFDSFFITGIGRVGECDKPEDEGEGEESVESAVKGVPEAKVIASDFPEFGRFVADKACRHEVEDALDDIQIAGSVDGVDCHCV